jgi:5-methylthioadenosine/S-adenosylhomocysteine deaminase
VRERDIPVMLAPDGVASNNNLDMFDEMKLAALMQKHTFGEPTRLPAHDVLRLATGGYSDVFSPWGVGGGLTVGAPADIALVNLEDPQMTPVHNIESNLAYAANGSMVDTVICAGEVVMEHRTVAGTPEVLREARQRATALALRADSGG